jgi:hypothetical protein
MEIMNDEQKSLKWAYYSFHVRFFTSRINFMRRAHSTDSSSGWLKTSVRKM